MSTENEKDNSSPPILHFIKESNKTTSPLIYNDESEITSANESKTESPSAHDNNTEQTTEDKNDEKPIKAVSHSRRVHFPTDDSQLRMISYTSDPFSKQPLLSLGVILQRYRAACQRLQLRPLNTLLDQLGKMDDGRKSFYDRLDCLKLVNEKLDLKHIDAIEEILSRCRFHTLDFDSSSIDDTALTQLLDVIEYYESCTHINLSNIRSIGMQGYQALTKYLRKTNSLERLDMNTTRFDDNSILSFTRSLRLSSTLYELHVESCQLNGRLLQKFIQNIRACTSLRELYLCDNRMYYTCKIQSEMSKACYFFTASR
jgi:protein phosphatase 1 regulatory subunit 37